MSPVDATQILDLPANANSEQIEARFLELRRKLEDKIAKAPTPGLQAKYRESLAEITTAFETLTLAADSSALPVLRRSESSPTNGQPSAARERPASPAPSPLPRASSSGRKAGGGREFAIVAAIAVLALAGGGWFVMKTRAENAEKERVVAEARAEAERAAKAKELAEQQEKERLAAAAKAEQEKAAAAAAAEKESRSKLSAEVRIALAETKLKWEQIEKLERDAERALSELKGEERSLRDGNEGKRRELASRIAAQSDFAAWLSDLLATHPLKATQVRAAEFLNSGLLDEAVRSLADSQPALADLEQKIASRKPTEADLYGSLSVSTDPSGVPWRLVDAFGRSATGITPGKVDRVAIGPATVVFQRPDWSETQVAVSVATRQEARAEFVYRPASLQFSSAPSGAEVFIDEKAVGRTPLTVPNLADRKYSVEMRIAGHKSWAETVGLNPGEQRKLEATLRTLTDEEFIGECTARWSGTWSATLRGTLFYCKFSAGDTHYVQRNGSGKYVNNPPSQIHLAVVSRTPLVLDQFLKFPAGRVGLDGSSQIKVGRLLEQDGQLIYVGLSPDGRNMGEVALQRTNQ